MSDMELIGLVGLKGSGKNTAGDYFVNAHGFTAVSFADCLKDCLSAIFGWDRAMLEGATPKSREWREMVDVWWAEKLGIPKFTPRLAMTTFGTDVMRKHFHEEIWLLNTERKIASIDGPVIITDVRMPNEMDMVRRLNGKVFRVERGPAPEWGAAATLAKKGNEYAREQLKLVYDVHESEWLLYGEKADAVIDNNTDLINLYTQCEALFTR